MLYTKGVPEDEEAHARVHRSQKRALVTLKPTSCSPTIHTFGDGAGVIVLDPNGDSQVVRLHHRVPVMMHSSEKIQAAVAAVLGDTMKEMIEAFADSADFAAFFLSLIHI